MVDKSTNQSKLAGRLLWQQDVPAAPGRDISWPAEQRGRQWQQSCRDISAGCRDISAGYHDISADCRDLVASCRKVPGWKKGPLQVLL